MGRLGQENTVKALCLPGRPLETLHHQAYPIPPHEAPAGVCEPQEWGQPGKHKLTHGEPRAGEGWCYPSYPELFSATILGFSPYLAFSGTLRRPCPISPFIVAGSHNCDPLYVPRYLFLSSHCPLAVPAGR